MSASMILAAYLLVGVLLAGSVVEAHDPRFIELGFWGQLLAMVLLVVSLPLLMMVCGLGFFLLGLAYMCGWRP